MARRRKNTPEKMHVMAAMEHLCHRANVSHTDLADLCDVSRQAMHKRFEWRRNCSVGIAAQAPKS